MTDLTVNLSKTVNAPIERVFDAWLDPEMLTQFILPDPQMPVIPVALAASANPDSSDHISTPIMRIFGSSVCGSIRTRSTAPGAAR